MHLYIDKSAHLSAECSRLVRRYLIIGRRKNNPDLVDELIDGLWTMDQDEFEEKYSSLSSSDRSKVSEAINRMRSEWLEDDDDYDDDDEDEENSLSLGDAALIYASKCYDEDYTFGYTVEELEDWLKG